MKTKLKTKLKIGDLVIVISGKSKGRQGKILSFNGKTNSVLVEGVNIVKKTLKKTQENQSGGIREQEAPIHVSNVMYYHSASKKGVRIGYHRDENGKKERVFKTAKEAAKSEAAKLKKQNAETASA